MTNILVIWQGRLAGAVAPSTGKIMKDVNYEIALQSQIFDIFWKKTQKKAPALKGLRYNRKIDKLISRPLLNNVPVRL